MRIEFWKLQPGPVDDLPRCDQPRGGRTTAILAAVSMPRPDCRQSGTMPLMRPRPLSLLPFCIKKARNALPSCCIRNCSSWRAVAQVAKPQCLAMFLMLTSPHVVISRSPQRWESALISIATYSFPSLEPRFERCFEVAQPILQIHPAICITAPPAPKIA